MLPCSLCQSSACRGLAPQLGAVGPRAGKGSSQEICLAADIPRWQEGRLCGPRRCSAQGEVEPPVEVTFWSNVLLLAVRLLLPSAEDLLCVAFCFQVQKWLVDVVKPQLARDWPSAEPKVGPPSAMRPPAPLIINGLGKVRRSVCVPDVLACHRGALPLSTGKADGASRPAACHVMIASQRATGFSAQAPSACCRLASRSP